MTTSLTIALERGMESLCGEAVRPAERAQARLAAQLTEAYALAARYREALVRITNLGGAAADIAAAAVGSPENDIEHARRLR
jgi:hypothetical protein